MDKKKRIKLDFSQPDQINQPVPGENVFIDNSGDELRRLQQEMLKRRMQRQNEEDPDGMEMNLKPQGMNELQPMDDIERFSKIRKLLGKV